MYNVVMFPNSFHTSSEQLQTQRSVQEKQFNNQKEMLENLMHEKNQADDQLKVRWGTCGLGMGGWLIWAGPEG